MTLLTAGLAGTGVWLLATFAAGRRGLRPPPTWTAPRASRRHRRSTDLAATVVCASLGASAGVAIFGSPLPAVALAAFAGGAPGRVRAANDHRRIEVARSSWPQLIEELRMRTGSLGASIPQALIAVGRGAPDELRPAFEAAEREWFLTTDLRRTLQVLKDALADPAADTVCETLLVAHELGGAGLDQRLAALADDRDRDLQHRRDAEARQAGARFARRFVLLVPAGMALAGMSLGTGRAAYRSPSAQVVVLLAIALVVACWVWAGRIMRLPPTPRVLDR